jgi:nucleoside-diphosphate-sugar epimerase
MNILLIGSNGFLGKVLYNYFKQYYKITTISRTNADLCIDITETIKPFNKTYNTVIFCAGLAHVSEDINNNFELVNVVGLKNILDSFNSSNLPKYFVYISSVSVYGLNNGIDIDENFPLLAKDQYGLSKIKAEQIITKWSNDNNVILTILRLPLIVGTNPPGNLNKMINAIKKGYYFNLDKGNARRSMILASDVAIVINQIYHIGGLYNLTDSYHPSYYEISSAIAKRFNKRSLFNISLKFANFILIISKKLRLKLPLTDAVVNKLTSTLIFDDRLIRSKIDIKTNHVLNFYHDKINKL